jgi:hypothetical protein
MVAPMPASPPISLAGKMHDRCPYKKAHKVNHFNTETVKTQAQSAAEVAVEAVKE